MKKLIRRHWFTLGLFYMVVLLVLAACASLPHKECDEWTTERKKVLGDCIQRDSGGSCTYSTYREVDIPVCKHYKCEAGFHMVDNECVP